MLKSYYAYLAVAGGMIAELAAGSWQLSVLACALKAVGALALFKQTRWYGCAALAALVQLALRLPAAAAVAGAVPLLLVSGVVDALLLLGMMAQRRRCALGVGAELALLAVTAVGRLGGIALLLFGAPLSSAQASCGIGVTAVNVCSLAAAIGLIADVFRTQRVALQAEAAGE